MGENEATKIEKLKTFFEDNITPALAGHGGFAEIVELKGEKLFIRIGGGCQGCAMAQMTVKSGIESAVMKFMPEITEVIDATNHAGGDNPYYAE